MKRLFYPVLSFILLIVFMGFGPDAKASSRLDNEPIDVVFKYIDLTDKNLHRDGIKQIKKDEDNEEIRYALRSVLQNMPWVRKIFIIMPNEKVRFLKPYDEIKDKIVYVKDKDMLGFDSASSITFEFNLWRLKQFGCSENFIYLNDDYFIGKPLNKSDFFYEENGRIVPYVIYASAVGYNQYEHISKLYNKWHYENSNRQTAGQFYYQIVSSFMFLYEYFGKDIITPRGDIGYFHHNAYGQNLKESKEIYDIVQNNYEHADACLRSLYRQKHSLTYYTIYSFYFINEHDKEINKIPSGYVDLKWVQYGHFNNKLFCINTSGDRKYSLADCINARIVMMKLFPKRTKYEIPEISDGIYEISSALNNNMVIDVQDASRRDEANIRLWERNNSNAQRFRIKYDGEGCYTIKAMCSGKMMDVAYADKSNEANIWQHGNNGTDAQKWYIVPVGGGHYVIVSKCNGLYVDVRYGSAQIGTNIQCFEGNDTLAQKFKFRKI